MEPQRHPLHKAPLTSQDSGHLITPHTEMEIYAGTSDLDTTL